MTTTTTMTTYNALCEAKKAAELANEETCKLAGAQKTEEETLRLRKISYQVYDAMCLLGNAAYDFYVMHS